jgi:hypothetical protein
MKVISVSASTSVSSTPSPGSDSIHLYNRNRPIPFPGAALLVVPSNSGDEDSGSQGSGSGSPFPIRRQPVASTSRNGQVSNNPALQVATSTIRPTFSPVVMRTLAMPNINSPGTSQTSVQPHPVIQYTLQAPTVAPGLARPPVFRNTSTVLPGQRVPQGQVVVARIPLSRDFLTSGRAPTSRGNPNQANT